MDNIGNTGIAPGSLPGDVGIIREEIVIRVGISPANQHEAAAASTQELSSGSSGANSRLIKEIRIRLATKSIFSIPDYIAKPSFELRKNY